MVGEDRLSDKMEKLVLSELMSSWQQWGQTDSARQAEDAEILVF